MPSSLPRDGSAPSTVLATVTRIAVLFVLAALTATFAPTLRNVAATDALHRPSSHPDFADGAYLLSLPDEVRTVAHEPAAVAVARILLAWDGEPPAGRPAGDVADVARTLRAHGLAGAWRPLAVEAIDTVPAPFVTVLRTAAGPIPVIVRDAYAGHALVTHPGRGNLMYPLDRLEARWPGRAFVLDPPPAAPEFWR
jgi:hypothetical protein